MIYYSWKRSKSQSGILGHDKKQRQTKKDQPQSLYPQRKKTKIPTGYRSKGSEVHPENKGNSVVYF